MLQRYTIRRRCDILQAHIAIQASALPAAGTITTIPRPVRRLVSARPPSWNLENWIKRMQWRIDTLSGCCGCIYSVRRDLYRDLPPEIISDLVQPLHVLLKHHRVSFQEGAQAWEEATRTAGEEFSMRIRVATRGMKGLL